MRIAIAEDERTYIEQLRAHLLRFAKETGQPIQLDVFSNGAALVESYRGQWDVLLLDVDMPVMSGLDAAKSIRRSDPGVLIIFITNLAQYAIKGYEVNALDYMIKPVSYYDLSMKLNTALRILRRSEGPSLLLNRDGELFRLPLSHLYYVEVYKHQLNYHTTQGELVMTTSKTLSALEEELAGYGFVRCHKGYLVNMRYIDAILTSYVSLAGEKIPLSRSKRKAVLKAMLDYAKGKGSL